jgi:ribose 5-phosphate isomerase B
MKFKIMEYLKGKGIESLNLGCNEKDNVDYVDYAISLGEKVRSGECNLGILICGTGIGMSIAANKMEGILAAKVNTVNEAKLCREHNQANVMTLSEYTENLFEVVDAFINTKPSEEERHVRRYNKIMQIK